MNDQLDLNADGSVSTKSALLTHAKSDIPPAPLRTGYLAPKGGAPKPPKRDDDEEDDGYFRRNRTALIVGGLLAVGVAWGIYRMPSAEHSAPPPKKQETVVKITNLPPPPPPPPKVLPPPPPKEEKKMEVTPVEKPADNRPKAVDEPPKGLGTSVKGNGPGMGLSGNRGLSGVIGGTGNGDGSKRLAAAYASKVGTRIAQELRNHPKTRKASMKVNVRVWADSSGRVTKAALDGSTGDNSLDEALKNEILAGIRLQEPPPQGMRMPILLSLNARRPGK